MARPPRTAACSKADARARLRTARAYLDGAELVFKEQKSEEFVSVSAGLAVLAGIAASDAICCVRLGYRHRGDDHRSAANVLEGATKDGRALATTLLRLLDIKDAAHYGVMVVARRRARDTMRWGSRLVDRAGEEIDR